MIHLLNTLRKNLLKSIGILFVCMLVISLGACSRSGGSKGEQASQSSGTPTVGALLDTDEDGLVDALDNCPLVANSDQLYINGTTNQNDCLIEQIARISNNSTNGPALGNNDLFGTSVAYLGDFDGGGPSAGVLAVGATGNNSFRGAVHLLYLNADGSVQQSIAIDNSTANGPNLTASNFFGTSVAYLGDLDGDGPLAGVLAVGAGNDDAGGLYSGAVHLLYLNTDGSVQQTITINSNTTNGPILANIDFFGYSMAYLGDFDGDGPSVGVLAVGAIYVDAGGTNRGAVYLLYLNADGSVQQSVAINSNTDNGPTLIDGAGFGTSVAYLGDLDGVGPSTGVLAVGATGDDTGGNQRGAVYLLYLNADGSVQQSIAINSNTTNGPALVDQSKFGRAMTYLGDLDGPDGTVGLLAVKAFSGDNGGTSNRDNVYLLYLHSDGTVEETVRINHQSIGGPDLAINDGFGTGIAWLGDLDGDGPSTGVLAIGADSDDTGGDTHGALHLIWLE